MKEDDVPHPAYFIFRADRATAGTRVYFTVCTATLIPHHPKILQLTANNVSFIIAPEL